MADLTQKKFAFAAALAPPNEDGSFVEGHYISPNAHSLRSEPSGERCPFCAGAMERISGAVLGRIVRDLERQRQGMVECLVDIMPPTHEALACEPCDLTFTKLKEQPEP